MLVKLQTTKFLIYAELDKTERVTHLAAKTGSDPGRAMQFSMRLSTVVIFTSLGAWRMTGIPILFGFLGGVDCVHGIAL